MDHELEVSDTLPTWCSDAQAFLTLRVLSSHQMSLTSSFSYLFERSRMHSLILYPVEEHAEEGIQPSLYSRWSACADDALPG